MESINQYFNIILTERSWSWSVVGIAYLIAAVMIRGWFLGPVIRRAKALHHRVYVEVKAAYLRKSVFGWILLLLPLFLLALFWRQPEILPLSAVEQAMLAGAAASFILSIMFHLGAFALSGFEVLRTYGEPEKGRKLTQ